MATNAKLSNNIIGFVNMFVFILSVVVFITGLWLSRRTITVCDRFLDTPLIILGVLFMTITFLCMVGSFCNNEFVLNNYAYFLSALCFVMLCYLIFMYVVTNKGAGESLPGKSYLEYRLKNYSHWLQSRVRKIKEWKKISKCLQDKKICDTLINSNGMETNREMFIRKRLSSVQSGCCKPSNDCNFEYVRPTQWNHTNSSVFTNQDCDEWSNDEKMLCYTCDSCKAGFLDKIKSNWRFARIANYVIGVVFFCICAVSLCTHVNIENDT